MWIWLVCAVITIVLHHTDADEVIGGPVQNVGKAQNPQLRIFVGHRFQQPGRITKWAFYALEKGTFYAGIWKPSPQKKTRNGLLNIHWIRRWTLISTTKIEVETTGEQEFWFPFNEGPLVKREYAISVHYPRNTPQGKTIVSEYMENKDSSIDVPLVKAVTVADEPDRNLYIGYTLKSVKIDKVKYFTSLTAYTVNPVSDDIRFAPDTHHFWSTGEGRIGEAGVIEVKPNKRWGTICETRVSDSSITKSQVAKYWGNKICKMLNPEYVMIDTTTRSLKLKEQPILKNVKCPDDKGLSACVSDEESLMENSCGMSRHQQIACIPDPDKYAIQVSTHMTE